MALFTPFKMNQFNKKNITVSNEDLENNAQLGFVNGISKIFMDNLKQLNTNFANMIYTNASITLATKNISIMRLLNNINPSSNLPNDLSTNLADGNNGILNSIIMLDKEIETPFAQKKVMTGEDYLKNIDVRYSINTNSKINSD